MAINQDGVLVTGGDDGTMKFWDWPSGYNYQEMISQPQPGSIAA
jgi:pleiotropic regulator 1